MSAPPQLNPQIAALLDVFGPSADAPADLAAQRGAYLETALRLGGAREQVAGTEDLIIDGRLPARAYHPQRAADPAGALLWIHGGGWLMGDLETHDHVCRALANASGHVVVGLDYRLAPEHPFPAAVHDADGALAWALGHGAEQLGYDAARLAVGGDSAGGNLAAVAVAHATRGTLRAQLLVYPALDAAMDSPSFASCADASLTRVEMAQCYETYLAGADRGDPDVSPLRRESLGGLPRTLVAVAGHDVLRDDGLRYAEALGAAGVDVRVSRYEDMTHGFLRWAGAVDRARELIDELGAFTRATLA